jgi:hypothetical protein
MSMAFIKGFPSIIFVSISTIVGVLGFALNYRASAEKVKMATALYKKQNDFYRRFMEESIVEDKESILTLLELYENFCSWYKLEGFRNSAPLKDEVKEYFEGAWGETRPGNKWKGYRMRSLKDDIESGEAVLLEDSDLIDYSNTQS